MLINFKCNNPDCENEIRKFFKKFKDVPSFLDCGACGSGKLERLLSAPTNRTKQYIDNGTQARRTEVMNEVIEQEQEKRNNRGD